MSPERNSIRPSPEAASKPYTKALIPIMLPTLSETATTATTIESLNSDLQEFLTRAQYKGIECNYLACLSPKRQGKALISQSIFDRIWDVLHNPNPQTETPQFRFWARKMFTLSNTHGSAIGVTGMDSSAQEVLLHDGLLVAVQEQIYDLLCYCHASTGHGGRDKTCSLIRKYYTWVPKDLVASFVKICPTCIRKKKGGSSMPQSTDKRLALADGEYPLTFKTEDEDVLLPQLRDPFWSGLLAAPRAPAINPRYSTVPPLQERQDPKDSKGSHSVIPRCSHSHPMVREVTLYKGLPNGWQARHKDYASAHAEFMESKNNPQPEDTSLLPDPRRRRIPSIAPLWGPDQFPAPEEAARTEPLRNISLPSITDGGGIDPINSSLPEELLPLLITQRKNEGLSTEFAPQIDPALLDTCSVNGGKKKPRFQGKGKSSNLSRGPKHSVLVNTPACPSFPPSSMKTSPSVPRLHLDTALINRISFQNFRTYIDNLASSDVDSPPELYVNPISSHPSLLSGTGGGGYAMSTTSSISPASTALPTPLDEYCPAAGFNETSNKSKDEGKREDNLTEEISGLQSVVVCGH